MTDERGTRKDSDDLLMSMIGLFTFVPSMDRKGSLDDVQDEQSKHEAHQHRRDVEYTAALLSEGLGQKIKADDTKHQSSGEAKYEVAVITDP